MIKLTNYTDKGGCGCKIDKDSLSKLLTFKNNSIDSNIDSNYLSMDDCAVSEFDKQNYLLSTLDFFSPLVDEPYLYGQISALNAVSDIYAMGGKPLQALSILGWPKELPIEEAKGVLEGASDIAYELNFSISGGHSIINPQPIFGLSITGSVLKQNAKRLHSIESNCQIYITKPIGIGILSSAIKRGILDNDSFLEFKNIILQSNEVGYKLGKLGCVKAMTDISGFGLIGHLINICKRSNINAVINYRNIPIIKNIEDYLIKGISTSVTETNYQKSKFIVGDLETKKKNILFDPQTNGGLLLLVENKKIKEFKTFVEISETEFFHIGETHKTQSEININIL
ncbi:selenide, water dikinase SelD [uncultured Winogradskyella sp.]|uniref:selenide, water dikinase SelD n=1 Tax=uncultured Winogradskyella sp. TaxID=395353 RepID=UPI002634DD0F|nr:selenide, water dikinase SelD [uncultured Winogradskyella sp.]